MNDAAQGVVEDVPRDVAQDLAFGARAARALLATPPPPPPCLCAVRAEMGAQLGSSVTFGSGCGQTLPGVPRKAPLCLLIVKVVPDHTSEVAAQLWGKWAVLTPPSQCVALLVHVPEKRAVRLSINGRCRVELGLKRRTRIR